MIREQVNTGGEKTFTYTPADRARIEQTETDSSLAFKKALHEHYQNRATALSSGWLILVCIIFLVVIVFGVIYLLYR